MRAFDLVGIDGNAYSIMGYVIKAMKMAEYTKIEQDSYLQRAMSDDYENLLSESIKMIDEVNDKLGLNIEYEDENNDDLLQEEAEERGENRLGKLISLLINMGKSEDIKKVSEDKIFRKELYLQYGIY